MYETDVVDYTKYAEVAAQKRNQVLTNTYWLLTLSLIPTVIGAWAGVASGAMQHIGWMGFLLFIVGAFGFMFAIEKTKHSGVGVAVLLAFTFFMGFMLSPLIGFALGSFTNGAALVSTAFGGTAVVFLGCASYASTTKRDLSGMGRWLFWGLMVLIASSLINIFFASSAMMAVISTVAIGIFSAYLIYDIKRVVDGGETNYITATLAVYLDLINIFSNLLQLLMLFAGDRR